ncbi:MAG TPA: thioredoxin family protein [Epsilonproteobacteria bacterium]|nr:thioredoxin family protein [Campylobacterota bacterium]
MKFISVIITFWIVTLSLHAQSYYVLTGIGSYDPIVANMSSRVDKSYDEDIKASMVSFSKELGIDTSKRISRVLAVVMTDVSVGDTVAVQVELSLGEYVTRQGSSEEVFALTYQQRKLIEAVEDKEEFEESLIDTVDEMLEKFALQYKEDNKKVSSDTGSVKHEDFASVMQYETSYTAAMAKAKKAKKNVMLFMTTNFCPWCRKMENRILSKADIDAQIKTKHIPLMLNFSQKQFPEQFHDNALTPTIYIIDPETEKVVESFMGYSSREGLLHYIK